MRKRIYVFALIFLIILCSCSRKRVQNYASLGTPSEIESTVEQKKYETLTTTPTAIPTNNPIDTLVIIPTTTPTTIPILTPTIDLPTKEWMISDLPPFEYGNLVKQDATATIEFYYYEGVNNPDDIISYIESIKELGFNQVEYINSYELNTEIIFNGTIDLYVIGVHLKGTDCIVSFGLSIYE